MTRTILSGVLAAATLVGAAGAQAPTPIRWSAAEDKITAKPGGTATVRIAAQIDEGWHLYALEPIEGGPIPTTLAAAPTPPFTLLEKEIDKPEPKRAQDPNFGIETAYYEDSASFGLPIAVSKDAPAGERVVEVTARFQACNDTICLRPQVATMRVTVKLDPGQ